MDALVHNKTFKGRPAVRDVVSSTPIITDFQYYLLVVVAWSIPVALTLLSVTQQAIFASTILAAVISGGILLFKPGSALVALPFFALLSPVAGFLEILDAHLLLSDILFILLAIQFIILFFQKQITFNARYSSLIIIVTILFLISCIAGFATGTLVSVKPVLYLLQLAIVYFYTTTFAKGEKGWSLVINAWLIAAFLGSLLLIQAFITGQPLASFKYGFDAQLMARENLKYLFQASYYYAGFHYVLGIAIVILFLRVLVCTSNLTRLFILMVLAVFVTALVIMANRTAMFSAAIAIAGVLFLSFHLQKKKRFKVLLLLVAVLIMASFFLSAGLLQFLGENQADLWVARLSGGSEARWEVYVQALTSWFTYPLHLLTGMGPDFLDGSGDTSISAAFKFSSVTGVTQGTVDSGWVSYLIELGVFTFAVLVALFVKSISSVLKYLKQINYEGIDKSQAVYVLGALFFISVALTTQMLGYTKLTWLPFQLLIIGFMHKDLTVSNKGGRERSAVPVEGPGVQLKAPSRL
jgi:hypothetical protein